MYYIYIHTHTLMICSIFRAGGDEPAVPIFGEEIEALSMPPIVPSKSVREMSPQNSNHSTPRWDCPWDPQQIAGLNHGENHRTIGWLISGKSWKSPKIWLVYFRENAIENAIGKPEKNHRKNQKWLFDQGKSHGNRWFGGPFSEPPQVQEV